MTDHLLLFLGITLLMLIVPGPDFVITTRNSLTGGRRQGYLTAAGICSGLGFLTVVTACGLAALIAASPSALAALRIAGGGYLMVLGAGLLLAAWKRGGGETSLPSAPAVVRAPVAQGFLNNVLNPKALIFYFTFMPQFLVESGPPVFAQTLVMGMLVVVCAGVWWGFYVTAVGYLSTLLAQRSVLAAVDVVSGVLLMGLGVWAIADRFSP